MNYDEKVAKLENLFAEQCDLDAKVAKVRDEIDDIFASFSPEETEKWDVKAQADWYQSMADEG